MVKSAPESKVVKENETPSDNTELLFPKSKFENQINTPVRTNPEPQPVNEEYPQVDIPCELPEIN